MTVIHLIIAVTLFLCGAIVFGYVMEDGTAYPCLIVTLVSWSFGIVLCLKAARIAHGG